MKKIYATGLALAVGMSAMAAPKAVNTQVMTMQKANLENIRIAPQAQQNKAPQRLNSVEELYGLKEWQSYGLLGEEGNEKYGEHKNVVTFDKGSNSSRMIIDGMPWGGQQTQCAVNWDAKTVTIQSKQVTGTNGAGGDDVYLYIYTYTVDADGKVAKTPASSATGNIKDDGTVEFPNIMFGASDPANEANSSYYYLEIENVFVPKSMASVNEADYELVGDGTFSDCFFKPLFSDPEAVPDMVVSVYRNKSDHNVIAVKNPYADPFWKEAELQSGDGQGWFQFTIIDDSANSGLVLAPMTQLLDCGMATLEEDGSLCNYYPYNLDGMYYNNGEIAYLNWVDAQLSAGENVSEVYENAISIVMPYFGVTGAPAGAYWWTNDKAHNPGTIQLPEGTLGVSNVAVDANAPVRYFNLQGMEVSAPVKGQVTIKSQNGKSTKFIAR